MVFYASIRWPLWNGVFSIARELNYTMSSNMILQRKRVDDDLDATKGASTVSVRKQDKAARESGLLTPTRIP
jgi:hypothetical protein